MLKQAIQKIVAHKNLTKEEAALAMDVIMQGQATPAQIAAFITALRMKGETVAEITGCAIKMREHAVNIYPQCPNLVDTCGTGGDMAGTFNISTIAALVAAGAGVSIAKHGNRSVSSRCGSADLLQALGVNIEIEPKKVEACINQIGIGFIFAPLFHQAMRFAAPVRKEIGIRTIFNILGPLTNPAHATAQVLGVYKSELTEIMAKVLANMGVKNALVVHSLDGLDEISLANKTKVSELKKGKIKTYFIQPEKLGVKPCNKKVLLGGSAAENAEIALKIIRDKEPGPKRNVVVLNAAAAIFVGGQASDLKAGIKLAAAAIDSNAAYDKLQELISFTNHAN